LYTIHHTRNVFLVDASELQLNPRDNHLDNSAGPWPPAGGGAMVPVPPISTVEAGYFPSLEWCLNKGGRLM